MDIEQRAICNYTKCTLHATNARIYVNYTNTFPKQVNSKLHLNYINSAPVLEHFIVPNEKKRDENEGKRKVLTV